MTREAEKRDRKHDRRDPGRNEPPLLTPDRDRFAVPLPARSGRPAASASMVTSRSSAAESAETRRRPGRVPWGFRDVLLGGLIGFLPFAILDAGATAATEGPSPVPGTLPLLFAGAATLWLYVWETGFAWIFSLQRYMATVAAWGLVRPPLGTLWKVPLGLAAMLGFSILYAGFFPLPDQDLGFPHSGAGIALLILTTCVMAPVFEEIIFRGFVFQGLIATFGALYAGLLSATLFSLAHWDLQSFFPLLVCGLALAWVYYSTRSLYASIILHALFNLVPTLVFVFVG